MPSPRGNSYLVRIRPAGSQSGNQIIGPFPGDLRRAANITPPVTDRAEVINTIILHGLPELIEPFAASLIISGRLDDDRYQRIQRLVNSSSDGAAGAVYMFQRRPQLFYQTDRAVGPEDRIFLRNLFDLRSGFT